MTKSCAVCGDTFTTTHRQQQHCSQTCGQRARVNKDPRQHRRISRLGGKATAIVVRRERDREWAAKYPGVPLDVLRTIRTQAYSAGWNRGNRLGYAQGWEACAQTMRGRVRAA
jgi:general stress protein YciG